jgi:hypothetical protein
MFVFGYLSATNGVSAISLQMRPRAPTRST